MTDNKNKPKGTAQALTLALPVGALTLLGALMLSVSNEAAIGLKLAEQHGESILLLREEVRILKEEIRDKGANRYTEQDAERDFLYIRREIDELKLVVREAHNVR